MKNSLYVELVVVADIRNRILRINRAAYNRMSDLTDVSTQMILEYQRMYHDFKIVIVE